MHSVFSIISLRFGLLPISQRNWKDYIVWPILKIFWEPWSGKKSHWWHWTPYKGLPIISFMVSKDSDAGERALWTFAPSNLWRTNFAWKKVAVMEPADNYQGCYQVGFIADEATHKQELCALILQGKSAGLVGAYDDKFFAITYPGGEPLPLKLERVIEKKFLTNDITLF